VTQLLAVENIVKRFSGTVALHDVNFDVLSGEVHVLLGENGAGKSTLMKILSGVYEPTSGIIRLGNVTYYKLTPKVSAEYGIAVIYQELSVIDHLSIEENLFVGKLPTKRVAGVPVVDRAKIRRIARDSLRRVGLQRSPGTLVGELSISEKQQVEIAKALASDARVIIMDEPTSSLTEGEVRHLFLVIGELKSAGVGIVYISHKLNEIAQIGDRVSVLKDGRSVGTYDARSTPLPTLVNAMVGRDVTYDRPLPRDLDTRPSVLAVRGLSSADGEVRNVGFDLRAGEILGFAGLIGAGRSELMETIFAVRRRSGGDIVLNGRAVRAKTPYAAVCEGMAFVTEDRRRTGFFGNFSIQQNIASVTLLRGMPRQVSLQRLDRARERRLGREYTERLSIRCSSEQQNMTELSGGNQQKAIIAKWLAAESDLFIFDEPTRGIDVGAKAEIYRIMRALAESGKGILMVSSELPELLAACDRIVVYREGGVARIVDNRDATEASIMEIATA